MTMCPAATPLYSLTTLTQSPSSWDLLVRERAAGAWPTFLRRQGLWREFHRATMELSSRYASLYALLYDGKVAARSVARIVIMSS